MFNINQLNKNIISGSLVHGLNILVALVSYPLFIKYLGFELFSVWTLLSVIVSFASMGDFGMGKAIIYYISKAKTENNYERIQSIIMNSIVFLILVSVILQIIIFTTKQSVAEFLAIPLIYIKQSVDVIPLIGLSVVTFLIYDCFSAVITGMGRIDISNSLLLLLNISKVAVTVTLLSINPSLESMAYGVLLTNFFFIGIMLFLLSKKSIISKFIFPNISVNVIKEIIKYGLPVFGIQVLNMLMFPIIKIVISKFFGITHVGFFELATKAAYAIRTLFEKGLFALLPEYAKIFYAQNDNSSRSVELVRKVKSTTFKLLYFGVSVFVLFSIFSPILLKIWLGANYCKEILYGFLLLQPGIITGLLALPSYYALMATNRQYICFNEALIRTILANLFLLLFFLNLNYLFAFIFVSLSVVLSNAYVIYTFFKRVN